MATLASFIMQAPLNATSSVEDDNTVDGPHLSLLLLRSILPAACIIAVVSTFAWQAFVHTVSSLQNVGYSDLPNHPSTPAVDSPLHTQPGGPLAVPANAGPEPDEDGIVPLTVATRQPRRGLIFSLLALVALTYLGDGIVFIVHGVITPVWEPRDVPAWTAIDWNAIEGLIAFCLCAIGMAYEEKVSGKPGGFSAGYPRFVALSSLFGEIAVAGLAGHMLDIQRRTDGQKLNVFSILHVVFLVLRILLLFLLSASYTRLLQRKAFVPHAGLAASRPASSYGTFEPPNGQQPTDATATPANGSSTPPQKGATNTLSTKAVSRPVSKPAGFKSLLGRVVTLFPYLWPHKSPALQTVALLCFLLIGVGRVVNLFVPIMLGRVTQALTNGAAPWTPLGIYVLLRFLQGSGGIVSVLQQTMWVPVAQFTDRSMSMMTFTHLLDLSLSYHTRRKTGEVLRILDRGCAETTAFTRDDD